MSGLEIGVRRRRLSTESVGIQALTVVRFEGGTMAEETGHITGTKDKDYNVTSTSPPGLPGRRLPERSHLWFGRCVSIT